MGVETVESEWDRVKTALTDTCKEKLGHRTQTYKSWLKEDTIVKIEERRILKQKVLIAKTRAQKLQSQTEYTTLNKEVKKMSRRDKRTFIDNMANKAQEAAGRQDLKSLYDITRRIVGHKADTGKPIKAKDGSTLTKPADQLERWKEHFSEILNGPSAEDLPVVEEGEELEVNMGPITSDEICGAVRKTKSGKAPGIDNIPPEALKADSRTTADVMQKLLQDIWEKEEIPEEWKTWIIIKLPKKGDLGDCNNWRGIQLLSLPSKILARILLERLKTGIDSTLRDEQAGFRPNRSCTDQIAALRIIIEQSLEWQAPIYMNFIDFRKAFDMIDRRMIWKIMKHYGIPEKFINIIRSFYEGMTCQVVHNSDLSPSFAVTTGVWQGCLLSPVIFLLVIDWVLKKTMGEPRGLQWTFTKRLEDLDFADDICLMSHTLQHIQEKTDRLQQTAESTGLAINTCKTKSMRINAAQNRPVTIQNSQVEEVTNFTYLGSVVSTSGGTEEDIRSRIGKAMYAFVTLRPIRKNSNISLPTKLKLFNSNVLTVLLYGSET